MRDLKETVFHKGPGCIYPDCVTGCNEADEIKELIKSGMRSDDFSLLKTKIEKTKVSCANPQALEQEKLAQRVLKLK